MFRLNLNDNNLFLLLDNSPKLQNHLLLGHLYHILLPLTLNLFILLRLLHLDLLAVLLLIMHKEFLYFVEVVASFIFLHAFLYSVLELKQIFLVFFVD